MSHSFVQTVKRNAEFVKTYILTLVNGQQHVLVAASPDHVMDMPEDSNIWTGQLLGGGKIEVPDSQFLSVEPDRYRVSVNNGQGIKSMDMNERELNKAIDRAPRNQDTGEVEVTFKSIRDRKTGDKIDID